LMVLTMRFLLAVLILILALGTADAQRGGGTRPPAGAPRGSGQLTALERRVENSDQARNALERAARRAAAEGYDVRDVLVAYDRDSDGRWFKRDEILIAAADPSVFETVTRLGLRERRRARLESAGVEAITFIAPAGTDMVAAVALLRQAFPEAAIDLNYIYVAQGEAIQPQSSTAQSPLGPVATVAVIDGPLDAPPSSRVSLATRRFADGASSANRHAHAVAAILARTANSQSLHLLAADVLGAGPIESAAADDIARALDWAAREGAGVINVSLTGPPSMTLALMARALAARGSIIVSAAGNGGPRAPAPYPAALPEVIGVTAVDAHGRIWRRATQGPHVDFAAHGVGVTLGGEQRLTGTSYAAPVVSGLLARRLPFPHPDQARIAQREIEALARDLGAPGRDDVYGAGLIEAP
jgi:subtilisin family serine protease